MSGVLDERAVAAALDGLDGWQGDRHGIAKSFTFDDFAGAIAFVNRVAAIAEDMNHHPDIAVSWNRVTLTIVSHSAGGVTARCVELAGRIDAEAA